MNDTRINATQRAIIDRLPIQGPIVPYQLSYTATWLMFVFSASLFITFPPITTMIFRVSEPYPPLPASHCLSNDPISRIR